MTKTRSQRIEEQDKFLRLWAEARWRLRGIPGVTHVGVGAKEVGGEVTGEMAFRVYVAAKRPWEAIPAAERIPAHVKHLPTDVLAAAPSDVLMDAAKHRPLKGGVQARNEHVRGDVDHLAGTLGCLAEVDNPGRDLVALGCEHVLMAGQSSLTVKVGQPDYSVSCCCCVHGQIGEVTNSRNDGTVDCAVVHLDEDVRTAVQSAGTRDQVEGLGTLTGVAQAVCFEAVQKRGRTTELTTGQVVDVLYEGSQILVHPTGASPRFADRGDSGAVIVNGALQVIGLLWATDATTRTKGVANHIGEVMRAMNILIAGSDDTGLSLPTSPCGSSSSSSGP